MSALVRFTDSGQVDNSFGTNGRIVFPVGVHGLAIQTDEAIVVAGLHGDTFTGDFGIMRFLADGSPDPSFGVSGLVTTDFHSRFDEPNDLTLLPDGSIVVSGIAVTLAGHVNFAVAKYLPNGALDAGFGGGDGKVSVDFANGNDWNSAHVIQPDGKIVLAGYSFAPQYSGFSFVRLNSDGSFDQSFGTGGKVAHVLPAGSQPTVDDVALQADGRIVGIGGSGQSTGVSDFIAARFYADGSLDTSFGTAGTTVVDFGGYDIATSISVGADNRILLSGWGGANDFLVARLRADGLLDNSFGTNGQVATDFDFSNDSCTSSILIGGKIIAVGSTSGVSGSDFAIARYDAGSLAPVAPPIASADFRYQTAPHRVLISFTSNVGATLSLSDLSLVNLTTGTTPAPGTMNLSYDPGTNVAMVTFPGLPNQNLADGRYRLTLSASGISDVNGFRLDGNGDGVPGDDYVHNFVFLVGDANHDGRVNLSDFNILAANFGQSPRDFTQGDFNYDAVVNLDDFNILAARFGVVLAGPGAATGPIFGFGGTEDEDRADDVLA
jgi:uncharacterized delta-60 repeat protein